jgi:hypothetical protein
MKQYKVKGNGIIVCNDGFSKEEIKEFKAYIEKQNTFLEENKIEWVAGTVLKGSGQNFADFENLASLKGLKTLEAMYFTKEQFEKIKDDENFKKWINSGEDICEYINKMVNEGGKLFMVNLDKFEVVNMPEHIFSFFANLPKISQTSQKVEEEPKQEKPKTEPVTITEIVTISETPATPTTIKEIKSSRKTITFADIFRKRKK